jgi:hypothetical protein
MRNITLILSLLVLGACRPSHPYGTVKPETIKKPFKIELNPEGELGYGYHLYVEGDCEYIRYVGGSGSSGLTHKGDCKNPIHCYNEISE